MEDTINQLNRTINSLQLQVHKVNNEFTKYRQQQDRFEQVFNNSNQRPNSCAVFVMNEPSGAHYRMCKKIAADKTLYDDWSKVYEDGHKCAVELSGTCDNILFASTYVGKKI
jgi:hypothetical protein